LFKWQNLESSRPLCAEGQRLTGRSAALLMQPGFAAREAHRDKESCRICRALLLQDVSSQVNLLEQRGATPIKIAHGMIK